uniref:NADH-ubiquinone oxidoreductase chain 1 n=1 Tax=Gmelinoides fasciatus TaxID=686704 RepID=A0A1L5BW47_9CRUS|nr:NADH dehydrogenase subunit 1 [Gmelinoides fasciatus]APL97189.1 NADH dehydrogenase subunit 1 [Gmelinoides fasciatus]
MVVEFSVVVSGYFMLLIMVLVSVAFVTLMEQKVLAKMQRRAGPVFVGYWGLLQPFSDAVKLLSKETFTGGGVKSLVYYSAPVAGLTLALVLWLVTPFLEGGLELVYGVLFFMCVTGLKVYPILGSGWVSNCKYSMLGSLRAVAQMISYEISMAVVMLILAFFSESFSFHKLLASQYLMWNFFLFSHIARIWMLCMFAETNRTPYDFSEGESELVSGFNTEYGSGGFTLIFMAEYASIMLMSMGYSMLFLSSHFGMNIMVKCVMVTIWVVWIRGATPRFRYDKLMSLAWKKFLPVSLLLFVYYLGVGLFIKVI